MFVSKETHTSVKDVWLIKATDFLMYLRLLAENNESEAESNANKINGNEASIEEIMSYL